MNIVSEILAAIKYAFKAVYAYLDIKKETFFFTASKEHLENQEDLRDEIIKLRNKGTTDATDRADRLMLLLKEREAAWERVSAAYSRHKSGD